MNKPLTKDERLAMMRLASDEPPRGIERTVHPSTLRQALQSEAYWREAVKTAPHECAEDRILFQQSICRWNDEHRPAEKCWRENCVWMAAQDE